MTEIESNIRINIETAGALASLKALQGQISAFHTQMAKGSATQVASATNMQQNLINNINATGKFAASMTTVTSSAETFTKALQANKLSMGEYFRYAGGASKSFGKLFSNEFNTIHKVATERVKDLQTQYVKMGRDANGAMQAIKVRPLALDMNDLGTKTAMAAQKQAILNQVLKQGSTNLLNWGKNTQWAGRQLMVGFSIPLMMVGTAAAKTYMQLETASIKLRRVYGDLSTTEAQTKQIANSVKSLGEEFTKFGIKVSDTMDLAAQIAVMGKTGNDLLTQVRETQRLVALGGLTTADALQTTVSLTNAFGTSMKDLATNVDFLNYSQNQTVFSIEDMSQAIPKAGPVVKQLGGDVKDLTFFMTAMKEGGINATQGANALKSGLASLINPTKAASDFLGNLGINITGIVQKDKGNLRQTVLDVAQAMDKLDPLNRARAIEKLFGKFQFARMSTLLKNVADPNSQAQTIMNIASKSKEELSILSERELKRVSDSPMYKFKKAVADLQVTLVPLGEQFVKSITPLAKFLTEVLKNFNKLDGGAKSFFGNLTMWVGGFGPIILMTIGLVGNAVANIIKMFAGIKSFFNNLGKSQRSLGEQTTYLTEEQINAKAAASSLEQAHSKLEQRFTSEAGAVAELTQAYRQAIAAQEAMGMAGMVARRVPVVHAATGIITGPGTGTSDSIPAMLSNGEAVIPAASVKKYPSMVAGLVAGNITGFKFGRNGSPANMSTPSQYENVFAHIGDPLLTSIQNIADKLTILGLRIPQGIQTKIAQGFGDNPARLYGGFGFSTRQSFNDAMKEGHSGVIPKDFLHDWDSRGLAKWNQSLKIAGSSLDEVRDELKKLDLGIRSQIESASELDKDFVVTDKQIKIFTNNTLKELELSGSELVNVINRAKSTPIELRSSATQATLFNRGYIKSLDNPGVYVNEEGNTIRANNALKLGGGQKGKSPRGVLSGARLNEFGQIGSTMISEASISLQSGAKKQLGIASPAKEFEYIGEMTGQGAIQGFEKIIPQMEETGLQLGNSFMKPIVEASAKAKTAVSANLVGLGGKSFGKITNALVANGATSALPVSTKELQILSRAVSMDLKVINSDLSIFDSKLRLVGMPIRDLSIELNSTTMASKSFITRIKEIFASIGTSLSNFGKTISPLFRIFTSVGRATISLERAQQRLVLAQQEAAGAATEETSARIAQAESDVAAAEAALLEAKNKKMGRGSSMGAGMALSMIPMAMSMSGDKKMAEVGNQLMMPAMGASMALMMLPGPIGIVVAGLIAVATGIGMFQASLDKARESGVKLANSMSMTNSKLIGLSEVYKTVSATETRQLVDKNNLGKITATGKMDAKTSALMNTSFGKSMVSDIQNQLSDGKTYDIIGQNVASQLATAITQGVISDEQARQIAKGLGDKLKNQTITANIVGNLTGLVGVNAQNFKDNPSAVINKLNTQQIKNFKSNTVESIIGKDPFEVQKQRGLTNQSAINTVSSIQQNRDALNARYDQLIAQNPKNKDLLNKQRNMELSKISKQSEQVYSETSKMIGSGQLGRQGTLFTSEQFTGLIRDSLSKTYKKDPVMEAAAQKSLLNTKGLGNKDLAIKLQLGLGSKELSPSTVDTIVKASKNNSMLKTKIALGISKQGTAATDALFQSISALGLTKDKDTVNKLMNLTINTKDGFSKVSNTLSTLSGLKEVYGIKLNVNTLVGNAKQFSIVNKLANMKRSTLSIKLAQKTTDLSDGVLEALKSKDGTISRTLLLTVEAEGTDSIVKQYLKATKQSIPNITQAQIDSIAPAAMKWFKNKNAAATALDNLNTDKNKNTQTTGTTPTDLIKQLQGQMSLSEGLRKLTSDGNIQGFIDLLSQADDATRKLYMTIGKDGKAVLNTQGNILRRLFDTKTVSDYVTKLKAALAQQKQDALIKKQLVGITKDTVLQTELMADADFKAAAAAILDNDAITDKKAALQNLVDIYKELNKATKSAEYASLSEGQKAQRANDVRSAYIQQYQDAIASLQPKEDAINQAYDDRVAALDKIQTLNDQINQQQKDQLDMADALSRGDIAAAAKTAQDIRAKAVTDSINNQKQALSDAKDAQLKALTVIVNGETLTIDTLTKRIAAMEATNAENAYKTIDPEKVAQAIVDNNNTNPTDNKSPIVNPVNPDGNPLPTGPTLPTGLPVSYPTSTAEVAALSGADAAKFGIDPGIVRVAQKIVASQVTKVPANSGWSLPSYLKGTIPGLSTGGLVPKYFADGGWAKGTDIIPAMLTPGEFVMKKSAVDNIGISNLASMNNSNYNSTQDSSPVYNSFSVTVNAATNANPNEIARVVLNQIQQIGTQKLRGSRL